MAHSATLTAVPAGAPVRPGWVPGSITPGPMGLEPHHRIPLAPGAMVLDPAPAIRSQMPDGVAAYAAAPAPAPSRSSLPVEAEDDDTVPTTPGEQVGAGLVRAALAIPVGMVVAGVIWELGYVASISGVVLAFAAAALYARGAGTAARKGAVPLILLILGGVALSFVACLVLDLNSIYSAAATPDWPSRVTFMGQMLTSGTFLSAYAKEALYFGAFGALGAGRVLLGLARTSRSS